MVNIMKRDNPCRAVCREDPATGWCVACLRTGEERRRWYQADCEYLRAQYTAEYPQRLATCGWDPKDHLAV